MKAKRQQTRIHSHPINCSPTKCWAIVRLSDWPTSCSLGNQYVSFTRESQGIGVDWASDRFVIGWGSDDHPPPIRFPTDSHPIPNRFPNPTPNRFPSDSQPIPNRFPKMIRFPTDSQPIAHSASWSPAWCPKVYTGVFGGGNVKAATAIRAGHRRLKNRAWPIVEAGSGHLRAAPSRVSNKCLHNKNNLLFAWVVAFWSPNLLC